MIVPTLNESASLAFTLESMLRVEGEKELIVADGGSEDGTRELARRFPVRVIEAERGRGSQLRAGAEAARGDLLWFVHADTQVPPDAASSMWAAVEDPDVVGGNFTVRFDSPGPEARFLGWVYPRLRQVGLLYGDSAIFVRRDAYERAGGMRPLPLFEDLDLVTRLQPFGTMALLPLEVTTSARRFEGRRFAPTAVRWSLLQLLYWLGVDARRLARFYAHVRAGGSHHPPPWTPVC